MSADLFTKEFYNWCFEPGTIFQVCIINLGTGISFYLDVNMDSFHLLFLSKISRSLIHYTSVYPSQLHNFSALITTHYNIKA